MDIDEQQGADPNAAPVRYDDRAAARVLEAALDAVPPREHRSLIGNALYYRILQRQSRGLTGKITGMILDAYWDRGSRAAVLRMVAEPVVLDDMIQEALDVLRAANFQPAAP
jgi:hypothetical protein